MPEYLLSSATFFLIAVNAVVSLLALYAFPHWIHAGYLMPYRVVRQHTWYELITSGFLHGSIGHLLFNMVTLFFFGIVMEQTLGVPSFLGLYFSGLIVSSIPSFFRERDNPNYATLGASGAVESVLFAFILLFPMDKIYIFLIPFGIPAALFGILFIAYSIYADKKDASNINHFAHIAGALWGIVYLLLFVPGSIEHIMTVIETIF